MIEGFNHWLEVMATTIGTFIAAAVGLALKYAHKQQRGEATDMRRIYLDWPMLVVAALAGQATHDYFHVPDTVAYLLATLVTYLGEKSITIALDIIRSRAGGGPEK